MIKTLEELRNIRQKAEWKVEKALYMANKEQLWPQIFSLFKKIREIQNKIEIILTKNKVIDKEKD